MLQRKKKVITYFTNWAQYRKGVVDGWSLKCLPEDFQPFAQDVICYAFYQIDSNYTIQPTEYNDEDLLRRIIDLKAINKDLEVFVAIGGWEFNSLRKTKHIFTNLCEKKKNRNQFIKSIVDFCKKHNIDGIDLDWEYPCYKEQGGRSMDYVNYPILINSLRKELDNYSNKHKTKPIKITLAIAANEEHLSGYNLKEIKESVSWFNLMTYDFHGSWDKTTGPHTALSKQKDHLSIEDALNYFKQNGITNEQIMMGIANYGRGWTIKEKQPYLGCKAKKTK
ncbi:Chitotriosidase-1 [Entamoeba marina]